MARSSTARKEYSRLRSIARKRIDRLQKSGLWSTDKANNARMALLTPTAYVAESDLALGIADLSDFLYQKPTTVTGAREAIKRKENAVRKAAQTLRENWDIGIRDEDMKAFGDYMDWMRERAIDEVFDSGDAAEEFDELRKEANKIEGVDTSSILKDFKYWMDHKDQLKDAQSIPAEYFRRARGEYGQTSRQLKNALSRYYNS